MLSFEEREESAKFKITRSGSVLTGLIPPQQPIQVFPKVGQSQGHYVKNIGINRKVLSQGINICNIKALSLLVQKLWSRLSFFFKSRSKVNVKVMGLKKFGFDRKVLPQEIHM